MMQGKQFRGLALGLIWRMIENDRARRRPRHQTLWAQKIIRRYKAGYRRAKTRV